MRLPPAHQREGCGKRGREGQQGGPHNSKGALLWHPPPSPYTTTGREATGLRPAHSTRRRNSHKILPIVPWYNSYFSGATPPKARTRNSSGVGRLKGRSDAPCRINFSSQTPTNHADWFLCPRGLGSGKPTPALKSSLDHEHSAPSIAPCLSGVRAPLSGGGGNFCEKNRDNKK